MEPSDARPALLERLIDHAPMYPPASLSLEAAVAEDERARGSESSFLLGRFVCPASRLGELPDVGRGLSVVLDSELEPEARVEAVEVPPGQDLDALPRVQETYVEVPLDHELASRLDELRARGLYAKVRCTGGPPRLGSFLRECRVRGIPYKATAGLHHALRTDREHGFLNLLAAAVFGDEERALEETDAGAFTLRADGFAWRDWSAGPDELGRARREGLRSIGSCSFFEPVEELEALGVLPL